MIKFMEWVRGIELVNHLMENLLSEARRGEPVDFADLARRFVTAAQQIISQSDLPDAVKTAAETIDKTPQLQPHVLGGKLRSAFAKAGIGDGSTQEDMIGDTFLRLVQNMPGILAKKYADKTPTAQELGNQLGALLQYDLAQYSVPQMWRNKGRMPANLSDVQADNDEERIEPSYEPKDPYATPSRPKLSRQRWNDAIKVVMSAQKNIADDIERINQEKTGERTTGRSNNIEKLNVTLALMRNMPMELARQIGSEGDGMTHDDNRVYARLAKMVRDPDSEMDAGDRALLSNWASQTGKVNSEQRDLIASAIWVASGMRSATKPDKALADDHWFFKYADIPDDASDEEDEKPTYTSPETKPDEPDEPDEPDTSGSGDDYSGSSLFMNDEPEPEPEPTPTRFTPPVEKRKKKKKKDKPEQRGLFDDYDDDM